MHYYVKYIYLKRSTVLYILCAYSSKFKTQKYYLRLPLKYTQLSELSVKRNTGKHDLT